MLIKDRTYKECNGCGHRRIATNEVYGCDTCKKVIDTNNPEREYLSATVHKKGADRATDIQCCSWRCMAKALRKVKTNYFVSMPFLMYEKAAKGMRAQDFFALLKK